ncbi:MAG: hypothetical protein Q9224_002389 [Gallowayella concinna]
MPTPNDRSDPIAFDPPSNINHNVHTTCPPEHNTDIRREHGADFSAVRRHEAPDLEAQQPGRSQPPQPGNFSAHTNNRMWSPRKMPTFDDEDGYASSSVESGEVTEASSSVSTLPSRSEQSQSPMPTQQNLTTFPESSDTGFRLPRMTPILTSSFLRPSSKFTGQQESDKQKYQVEVELKYVDMAQSSLCGYLKIEGKDDCPPFTYGNSLD